MGKLNQLPSPLGSLVGIVEQWDNLAEKYGGGVLSQRYILLPGILNYFLPKLGENSYVLDLGCGNGKYSELFADKIGNKSRVKGIDISPEQIALAKKENPDIDFQVGSVREEESDKYTDIFANMVVCNISPEAIDGFLGNISRSLKAGGEFIMTNVHSDFQKTFSDKYMSHKYPEIEVGELVKEGSQIQVGLNLVGGGSIGPFTNYHYSLNYLKQIAARHGLKFESEVPLRTTEDLPEGESTNTPVYSMMTFRKN